MLDLKNKDLIVIGYDTGAGIALKMAVKNSSLFKKIIAFLPNYSEEKKDELKNLKIPVLVIWIL